MSDTLDAPADNAPLATSKHASAAVEVEARGFPAAKRGTIAA